MNKKEMEKAIEALEELVAKHSNCIGNYYTKQSELENQVNCAEDYGHDYVFVERKSHIVGGLDMRTGGTFSRKEYEDAYTYKCSRCNRTVDYTWDELTIKDRNALKTLGIVE